MRIWAEERAAGVPGWRGKVQHLPSGASRYFQDWETLLTFLQASLTASPDDEDVATVEQRPVVAQGQREARHDESSDSTKEDNQW